MKKVLFVLSLMLPVLFSCSSDEDSQYVAFDKSELEVEWKAGRYSINVNANCDWDIESDAYWIYIAYPTDASTGKTEVFFRVKENRSYSDRFSIITVSSLDGSSASEIKIIQKENKGIIGNNEAGEFDGEKQNITVDIKTNIENPSIDMPDWITVASKGRALSDKSYVFTLSKNDTGIERTGSIVFSGEGRSWEYTVRQKPIQVLPSKITFKEGENVLLDNNSDLVLTPVFTPVECTEKDLEWTSSNTNVVTVSDGVLKVVGSGEARITAKSKVADISASINVTVKIKAVRIIPTDEFVYNMYTVDLGFDQRKKISVKVEPVNAYVGDLVYSSSNPDVVSVDDGILVANSNKEGTSVIEIKELYSGLSTSVNVTVKRCFFSAGFKNINQTVNALMMSFGGRIYTNGTVEILGATLVDENNRVITLANNIGNPSNDVSFYTNYIDMTSLFGVTTIGGYMPNLRFLVSYRYNNSTEIYQEYINIDMNTEIR